MNISEFNFNIFYLLYFYMKSTIFNFIYIRKYIRGIKILDDIFIENNNIIYFDDLSNLELNKIINLYNKCIKKYNRKDIEKSFGNQLWLYIWNLIDKNNIIDIKMTNEEIKQFKLLMKETIKS